MEADAARPRVDAADAKAGMAAATMSVATRMTMAGVATMTAMAAAVTAAG